jgi:hypothetical protein
MRRFDSARLAINPSKKFKVWNIRSNLSHGAVPMQLVLLDGRQGGTFCPAI